jgi:uncharacterized membrane protein YciS (DUF1049 family)
LRSYILAIAFSIVFAVVYSYQNAGDIYVKFLMFERQFPQGVWEALLFSVGVLLMWLFSIFASIEGYSKHKAQIKERDEKIALLEEEKKSLLAAFNHLQPIPGLDVPPDAAPETLAPAELEPEEKGTVSD